MLPQTVFCENYWHHSWSKELQADQSTTSTLINLQDSPNWLL